MEIRDLIDQIEDLLNKIREKDREQRRKIREIERLLDLGLPPLVPGSGIIADKE